MSPPDIPRPPQGASEERVQGAIKGALAKTAPPEAEPLDWHTAAGIATAKRAQRKRVVFENYDGHGRALVFVVRQLSQAERDEISDHGVEVSGRGRNRDVKVRTAHIRRETLKRGILEGPPGWVSNDVNIELLDPDVLEELVEAIDDFSRLSDEHKVNFRGPR